jgi:hypothetical protein
MVIAPVVPLLRRKIETRSSSSSSVTAARLVENLGTPPRRSSENLLALPKIYDGKEVSPSSTE